MCVTATQHEALQDHEVDCGDSTCGERERKREEQSGRCRRQIDDVLHIDSLGCYTKVDSDGSLGRLDEGLDSIYRLFESDERM